MLPDGQVTPGPVLSAEFTDNLSSRFGDVWQS